MNDLKHFFDEGMLKPAESGFSVLSFNVHLGGMLADFSGFYDLPAVLKTLSADIGVFQEISLSKDGSPPLREVLSGEYHLSEPPAGPLRWEDNGVAAFSLAVASRFPILDTQILPLMSASDNRRSAALKTIIDTPLGEVTVIGVHMTTEFLPAGSAVQVASLAQHVRKIEGPVVIAGDHNLWRTVVRGLLPRDFKPSFEAATWPAKHPHSQIDHIWVRGLQAHGCVLPDQGSDHLPAIAHITPTN